MLVQAKEQEGSVPLFATLDKRAANRHYYTKLRAALESKRCWLDDFGVNSLNLRWKCDGLDRVRAAVRTEIRYPNARTTSAPTGRSHTSRAPSRSLSTRSAPTAGSAPIVDHDPAGVTESVLSDGDLEVVEDSDDDAPSMKRRRVDRPAAAVAPTDSDDDSDDDRDSKSVDSGATDDDSGASSDDGHTEVRIARPH